MTRTKKASKDPFLCVTQKKLDSLDLADSIDQTLFPSVLRPAVRSEIKQESECKARVKKSKKDHRIFETKYTTCIIYRYIHAVSWRRMNKWINHRQHQMKLCNSELCTNNQLTSHIKMGSTCSKLPTTTITITTTPTPTPTTMTDQDRRFQIAMAITTTAIVIAIFIITFK